MAIEFIDEKLFANTANKTKAIGPQSRCLFVCNKRIHEYEWGPTNGFLVECRDIHVFVVVVIVVASS